jgi:hypothetical protein
MKKISRRMKTRMMKIMILRRQQMTRRRKMKKMKRVRRKKRKIQKRSHLDLKSSIQMIVLLSLTWMISR